MKDAEKSDLWKIILVAVLTAFLSIIGNLFALQWNQRAQKKQTQWELKRGACLKALTVADAVFANLAVLGRVTGVEQGHIRPVKLNVDEARAVLNELTVACENDDVPRLFLEMITSGQSEGKKAVSADRFIDFRNAVRRELDFGQNLTMNRKAAWISYLPQENP